MKLSAFSAELKVGTLIGDYRLPVVTEGAEPQKGGGIARAWIIESKVNPQYINGPMMVFMPEGTVVVTDGRFVKIWVFVNNTCQALLADQLGSSCMAAWFGKLS